MLKLESSDKMYSIRELYRIGRGPSGSHTMGPSYACQRAMDETPAADGYEVTLLGSLENGLRAEGIIPEGLGIKRKAARLFKKGQCVRQRLHLSITLA